MSVALHKPNIKITTLPTGLAQKIIWPFAWVAMNGSLSWSGKAQRYPSPLRPNG